MKAIYLVKRFPVLSQTFVQDEIMNHLRFGVNVQVVSLEGTHLPHCVHDPVLSGRVHYLALNVSHVRLIFRALNIILMRPSRIIRLMKNSKLIHLSRWREVIRSIMILPAMDRHMADADVIHCHFGDVGQITAFALLLNGSKIPLITTIHAHEISKIHGRPLHIAFDALIARCNKILCVSSMWRDKLMDIGAETGRTVVHRVGVDVAIAVRSAEKMQKESKRLSIVIIGRLVEKKGHIHAIRTAARLKLIRPNLKFDLHIVGGGPLAADICQAIKASNVTDRVVMHGPLSHDAALDLLACADIFMLPSVTATGGDMEGIPVAIMEAMALGLPVVSTYHGGIPELVEHGVSGMLCCEGDDEAMFNAIVQLAENSAYRHQLGKAGYQKIVAEFDQAQLCSSLRNIYREVGTSQSGWH
jgi:colanic acid/amylovoran biosynthesis glycosyltransferase